jgi:hypothetical protein
MLCSTDRERVGKCALFSAGNVLPSSTHRLRLTRGTHGRQGFAIPSDCERRVSSPQPHSYEAAARHADA